MLSQLLKLLLDILPKFITDLLLYPIPPITIEVSNFHYSFWEDSPDIIVLPPPPRSSYWAKIRLTNWTSSTTYVKDISVTVNDSQTYKYEPPPKDKICLQSHEYADLDVCFPVPDEAIPDKNGTYSMIVIPAVGRKTRVNGSFS